MSVFRLYLFARKKHLYSAVSTSLIASFWVKNTYLFHDIVLYVSSNETKMNRRRYGYGVNIALWRQRR